jgi:hypothetical protein
MKFPARELLNDCGVFSLDPYPESVGMGGAVERAISTLSVGISLSIDMGASSWGSNISACQGSGYWGNIRVGVRWKEGLASNCAELFSYRNW